MSASVWTCCARDAARDAGFSVVGYRFDTPFAIMHARNAAREGKARVPDVALLGTLKRMETPVDGEGFDALYSVVALEADEFEVTPSK